MCEIGEYTLIPHPDLAHCTYPCRICGHLDTGAACMVCIAYCEEVRPGMSETEYRAECSCGWKGNRLCNQITVNNEAGLHRSQCPKKGTVNVVAYEPLKVEEVKFIGDRATFDEETYRQLFNNFQLKPTDLSIKNEKSLLEMTDQELLDWVHKMEDFVRVAKVASTSARVRLEDRKLQLTTEQREALAKLDRQYKPATRKAKAESDKPKKTKEPAWKPTTEFEKKVAAAMKILGMTKEAAEAWVTAQTGQTK